jgi:hypothetical protein
MIRAVNSTKEELWRSRLRRFESSGMSVKRFCRRERVSEPTFYQWRKRLALADGSKTPAPFVPVRVVQLPAVEIQLPNGARVRVPAGQAEALRLAIEVAGQLERSSQREVEPC